MTVQQIAASIPSDTRQKILLEWLPNAKPIGMGNVSFKLLYEAYFIYVDPNGIRKDDCMKCLNNVYENWQALAPYLRDEEKDNNLLNAL